MNLKYRPLNGQDKDTLTEWIARDPDHKGRCNAEFWTSPPPQAESFVVEDEQGKIFYVRTEKLLRIHIQFDPTENERTKAALEQFCSDIKKTAKPSYKQVVIETVFRPLALFLLKQGMRRSKNEMVFDFKDSN